MHINKHLSLLLLLIALWSCNDDPKTTFSEINISTSNNSLVEANIPNATGDTLITNNINAEINAIVMSALQVGDSKNTITKTIEESIDLFNSEYSAFNKDFPESSLPWEAQIDGEILFESTKIISVSITSYVNTGGAHGNTSIKILNFDAETGKKLQNKDLIKDEVAFKKIVKSYLKIALKEDGLNLDDDSFKLPENLGYTTDGLVLLYNMYELEPFSTDILEFTIPFEKITSLLVFDSTK